MSETQNRKCIQQFVSDIVDLYEETWLKGPNQDEVLKIAKDYKYLGFPGCIEAVG